MSRRTDVLVVAATPEELRGLLAELKQLAQRIVAGRPVYTGKLGTLAVAAVVSGIGKANAAMATATVLQHAPSPWVLSLGVGGAYPNSGLDAGDLAVATSEQYGDEGVETPSGWLDLEAMGMPLWQAGDRSLYGSLPTDAAGAASLAEACREEGAVASGAFVTVSAVTGTAARAQDLEERFSALCETMEGAAVAHAALIAGSAFVEVRGISNRVGPRDRASWQLERAAGVACRGAVRWLRSLSGALP